MLIQVKVWTSISEPEKLALLGYETGVHAPGNKSSGTNVYKVGHNLLLAHAHVYNLYKHSFKNQQHGK